MSTAFSVLRDIFALIGLACVVFSAAVVVWALDRERRTKRYLRGMHARHQAMTRPHDDGGTEL